MEIPTPIEQGPMQAQRVPAGESSGPSGSQSSEIFGAHLTRLLNGKPPVNASCSSSPSKETKGGTEQDKDEGTVAATSGLLMSQILLTTEQISVPGAQHILIQGGQSHPEGGADLSGPSGTVQPDGNQGVPGMPSTLPVGGQSEPGGAEEKGEGLAAASAGAQETGAGNGSAAAGAVSLTGQTEGTAIPDAPATPGLTGSELSRVYHSEKSAGESPVDAATPKVSEPASKAADSTGAKDRERVSRTPEPINIIKKDVPPDPEANKQPQMSEGNVVISEAKRSFELSEGEGSARKAAAPALAADATPPASNGDETRTAGRLPDQTNIDKAVFSGPQPVSAETEETKEGRRPKDEHPRGVSASGEAVSMHEGGSNGISTARTVHQKAEVAQVQTFRESFVITKKDGNSIEVSLKPEGMGKLQIHLSLDGETIHARVGASEAVGRDFIDRNIQNILNALSDEGINIGSFSVHLRDRRDDTTGGDRDARRYRSSGEEPVAAAVSSGDTLVNIFV